MLGNRLLACAGQVRAGNIAADIGTDHGLLPVYLALRGVCPRVIACDLREGPLRTAEKNVKAAGVASRVELRLSNGLSAVAPGEARDIIAAGMGGDLIARILEPAAWLRDPAYRLILQPMSKPEALRRFLYGAGFAILGESAVRDAGRIYTVITAAYTGEASPGGNPGAEIYLGGLPEDSGGYAGAYLKKQLLRLARQLAGLRAKGAPEAEIDALEEIRAAVAKAAQRLEKG